MYDVWHGMEWNSNLQLSPAPAPYQRKQKQTCHHVKADMYMCMTKPTKPAKLIPYIAPIHMQTVPRQDEEALEAELIWASGRRCSEWPDGAMISLMDSHVFYQALTKTESDFLDEYEKMYPQGIYSLNQDPAVTCMGTNHNVPWFRFPICLLCC